MSLGRKIVGLVAAVALPAVAAPASAQTRIDPSLLQGAFWDVLKRTSNVVETPHGVAGAYTYKLRSSGNCVLNFASHFPGGRTADNYVYDAWTIERTLDWKQIGFVGTDGRALNFNPRTGIRPIDGFQLGTAAEAAQAAELARKLIAACASN